VRPRPEDLTGKRFGKWTVLRYQEPEERAVSHRKAMWVCRCDCGTEAVVKGYNLRAGLSKACKRCRAVAWMQTDRPVAGDA
jgi:hypothetical protein